MGCIKTCHGLYVANSCSVHQTPGARAECSPVQTHTRPCHSRGLEMGVGYPPAAPPGGAERERLSMDVVQVSEISKGTERWSSAHSTTLNKEATDGPAECSPLLLTCMDRSHREAGKKKKHCFAQWGSSRRRNTTPPPTGVSGRKQIVQKVLIPQTTDL